MSPMWPFKPKKEIGEICTDFYASHVFRPEVTLKKGPVLWDGALQSIENVNYAISGVPREEFVREFNALRVELFGLAWAHQHDDAEYVLREVLFTRRYLEAIGRPDVWTAMAEYSSTVESASGQTGVGLQQREARLKRFEGEGVDPDSGQRAVNRLGTEASWQDGGTVEALATTFPERLGRPLRAQGAARGVQPIVGAEVTPAPGARGGQAEGDHRGALPGGPGQHQVCEGADDLGKLAGPSQRSTAISGGGAALAARG